MKLNSIQFLRAVAVLLIVYAGSMDLQMQFSWSNQQDFYHLQKFGAIGIDLFFVISGFIITYSSYNYTGAAQGARFLTKRFFRINPVYYITSLVFFGVALIQGWKDNSSIQIDKTINSAIDTMLIIPSSGDVHSYKPMLDIGWPLSFGWLFYILFFLLILSKTRYKVLFMGIILTGLVALGYLKKTIDYRIIFITNPIILEFLLGVLIAWLYLRIKTILKFIPTTCILIALLSYIALIAYSNNVPISDKIWNLYGFVGMRRFLIWGIPSAFLVAGCLFMEKNNQLARLWNNKWLQLTGNASFSIYLVHITVFSLLTMLYKGTGFFLNPDLAIWLQLALAVFVSICFYKLVEKPLLERALKIRKPISASMAISMESSPAAH